MAQGQANGYSAIASIVYGTIDGFIKQTERAALEIAEAAHRDGIKISTPPEIIESKQRGRKKKNVANSA
jgi:hypothetical protein